MIRPRRFVDQRHSLTQHQRILQGLYEIYMPSISELDSVKILQCRQQMFGEVDFDFRSRCTDLSTTVRVSSSTFVCLPSI